MSRRRRTLADWSAAVIQSRSAPTTKVLLWYVANHCGGTGYGEMSFSRPRSAIAKALGKSERVIDQLFQNARNDGFISVILSGHKGRTAVYALTFPTSKGADSQHPLEGTKRADYLQALTSENQHPLSGYSANPGVRTIGKHFATLTPCETCGGNGCALCCGEVPA